MSIFKREPDPPYNRAAASRAAATPTTPAAVRPETTSPPAPPLTPAAPLPVAEAPAMTPPTPLDRQTAAVVDRKTEITGTLHSTGNVLIEGRFHGEVEANETVWIEKGAQSDGQIRASAAVISGAVDGQIECGSRLQIAATAVVKGEIKTPSLVIEDGATVNCRFSMTRSGASSAGKPSGGKR